MKITFDLSESDIEYFRQVMQRACALLPVRTEQEIVESARGILEQVLNSDTSDFIRERIHQLETIIAMVVDAGWRLEAEDRTRALLALAYFSEPEDLIPDDIPGLGFLDDAIMIEIVTQAMTHEIQAYREFCVYRTAEAERQDGNEAGAERADGLEERRRQLHARMRKLRRRGKDGGNGGSNSPFSLFRQLR